MCVCVMQVFCVSVCMCVSVCVCASVYACMHKHMLPNCYLSVASTNKLQGAQIISMIYLRVFGLCEASQINSLYASFCKFLSIPVPSNFIETLHPLKKLQFLWSPTFETAIRAISEKQTVFFWQGFESKTFRLQPETVCLRWKYCQVQFFHLLS